MVMPKVRMGLPLLGGAGVLLFLAGLAVGTTSQIDELWAPEPAPSAPPPTAKPVALRTLALKIADSDWQRLVAARDQAIQRELLVDNGDWVPVDMAFEGRSVAGKVRLKGDWTDHLARDKAWSLRVKVRRSDTERRLGQPKGHILGLRKFSIQHPSTRGDQVEPLFLEHMRREGILAPRYDFVRVTVNDSDWGLMAVEEHFAKELLEHERHKEGVIARFDESDLWDFRVKNWDANGQPEAPYGPWTAPFEPFRRKRTRSSSVLTGQLSVAQGLIAAYQEGRLGGEEIFDLDRLARFLVLCELWGGHHAHIWTNLRFYVDPYDLRLEPVAFDNGEPPTRLRVAGVDAGLVWDTLLAEPAMQSAITRQLDPVARRLASGELLDQLQAKLEHVNGQYVSAGLVPPRLSLDVLRKNAQQLLELGPGYFYLDQTHELHRHVTSHLYTDGRLVVLNALTTPVTVEKIVIEEFDPGGGASQEFTLPVSRTIAATPLHRPASSIEIALPSDRLRGSFQVKVVTTREAGAEPRTELLKKAIPFYEHHPLKVRTTVEEILQQYPWLKLDHARGRLVASAGNWTLSKPLDLPPGIGLEVPAGVALSFAEQAYLRLSGPLDLLGTKERPIKLSATGDSWKGIQVDRPERPSIWRHVLVERTAPLTTDALSLTGAVTFRNAEVSMQSVIFDTTSAEDALNLVHTKFTLEGVVVRNTQSDGLDMDFCDGVIKDSRFVSIGGDALDVSGTRAEVLGLTFESVADKAISVGERSTVEIRDCRMVDVGVGVACKDESRASVNAGSIERAKLAALAAWTKKPEYGSAKIIAQGVKVTHSELALVQHGNQASVDGRPIAARPVDVEKLYAQR